MLQFFQAYRTHNAEIITVQELASNTALRLKPYKQSVYYGIFLNQKRHGKGVMIYQNGRLYEGEWENDLK
jgi:hypothetical protein